MIKWSKKVKTGVALREPVANKSKGLSNKIN
jgi:hypothetical protein